MLRRISLKDIDQYIPDWDFREYHQISINAPSNIIYREAKAFDFHKSKVASFLFWVRGLKKKKATKSKDYINFQTLSDMPNRELVLGLVGIPWKTAPQIYPFKASEFKELQKEGLAKIAYNFYLEKNKDKEHILSTETKIKLYEQKARSSFRLYWFIIRPFSGLIRHFILRGTKKRLYSKKQIKDCLILKISI